MIPTLVGKILTKRGISHTEVGELPTTGGAAPFKGGASLTKVEVIPFKVGMTPHYCMNSSA